MNRKQNLYIVLGLMGLTLALYWPATGFDFTNFDDPEYVTINPMVNIGLTWKGVVWAFVSNCASNWHPLTWISHMIDVSLFGLNPGRHHLTNLLLHAVNAAMVFLVLLKLTASRWRSALVAALFAWHPTHVESVAWIAERKDLLSTFFWFLAIGTYVNYARGSSKNPEAKPTPLYRNGWYLLTLLFLACGLLAKPMVVTLPFVFMLLDLWPLSRTAFFGRVDGFQISQAQPGEVRDSLPRLLPIDWMIEKIPFFGLSLVDCLATFWAQHDSHAMVSTAALPLSMRMGNTVMSYVFYLGKLFCPTNLTIHYSYSIDWTLLNIGGAAILLLVITGIAVSQWRLRPFLCIGWFWFLGTLVPVIGLVQVGAQSMADRYTYIPATGIFIMLAWSLPAKWFAWPRPGMIAACATGGVLFVLITLTEMQLQYWRNSITLFTHAVDVSKDDVLAEYNLGEALTRANDWDNAIPHFQRVLVMKPNRVEAFYDSKAEAHFNLGLIYQAQKKWKDAEEQFRAFLELRPQVANGQLSLGAVLVAEDRLADGLMEFRLAFGRNQRNTNETEVLALSQADVTYAGAGMPDKAVVAGQQTLERAIAYGDKSLIEATRARLEGYKKQLEKGK